MILICHPCYYQLFCILNMINYAFMNYFLTFCIKCNGMNLKPFSLCLKSSDSI